MATWRPDLSDPLPLAVGSAPPFDGPLMTLDDWKAVARAPRRPAGVEVTMQAKRVRPWPWDAPLPFVGRGPDHMFLQFDDGQNALIARGGPTGSVAGVPDHLTRVTARVDQADLSPDSGKGYRTLAKTFIPGVTADEAAAGARQHAQGARLGGNAYGADRNSNSYAEDAGEPIFKRRVGDSLTWGYQTRLRDDVPASVPGTIFTGPLDPDSWAPIIRNPPY